MKILKFKPELCEQIMRGEKRATWRLFDEKNLQISDEIQLLNRETGNTFGYGVILNIKETTLGSLVESDWEGHEHYASENEMYETFRLYYGNEVGPNSPLKIVAFSFSPL